MTDHWPQAWPNHVSSVVSVGATVFSSCNTEQGSAVEIRNTARSYGHNHAMLLVKRFPFSQERWSLQNHLAVGSAVAAHCPFMDPVTKIQLVRSAVGGQKSQLLGIAVGGQKSQLLGIASGQNEGKATAIENLWRDFFTNPSEWRDIRFKKRNQRFPDFVHSATKEALWIDGWMNPTWVEAQLYNLESSDLGERSRFLQNADQKHGRPTGNMIRQLCKEGQLVDAFQAVNLMAEQGFGVSTNIFYCLLKGCINKKDLYTGKELYNLLMRNGFLSNAFLGCHLIRMFAACGSILEANQVFCTLQESNVFIWNAIISAHTQLGQGEQAIKLFYQMQLSKVRADEHIFVAVLKACCSIAAIDHGKLIHAHITESGSESNAYIGCALVDMYVKVGSLEEGRIVLGEMSKPSVVTWNAIIGGYAQFGNGEEALHLFHQMQQRGTEPNDITYVCILKACSSIALLIEGQLIHAAVVEGGLESDVFIGSTIIDMYGKLERLAEAKRVFDKLSKRDVVTWSAMIGADIQHGQNEEALKRFFQMQQEGLEPNHVIYTSIVRACGSTEVEHQIFFIHGQIAQGGLDSKTHVGTALIDMYLKSGFHREAQRVFSMMTQRSAVTWSTMIAGFAHLDYSQDALQLFEQMQQGGLVPTDVTVTSALKACSSEAALSKGKLIHSYVMESDCEVDTELGSMLINMYTDCGSLEDAQMVFEKLPEQSVVTFSAMIAVCARHSDYKLARHYFKSIEQRGFKPDEITFVCLLSACSHAGQIVEGCLHWKTMVEHYQIIPSVDHYNCMINLLGFAGYLIEAQEVLQTMPFSANVVGWTSLLGHCKTCGNVDLGRHCFDHVALLNEKNASGYVLMLEICSNAGLLEDADIVLELRKSMGAWKKPGRACIEFESSVHYFVVDDRGNAQSHCIYEKLRRLIIYVKWKNYVPCLDLVVQPMLCEDKKSFLYMG